ncbi:F-box protein [Tanacetum coccineum]
MVCCFEEEEEEDTLQQPLHHNQSQTQTPNPNTPSPSNTTISPMNSNFPALICKDILQTIFESLSVPDLARCACVCKIWSEVAGDGEIVVKAFKKAWKVKEVIGKPSSGGFWRDAKITKFAVSHRVVRGDSVASLAVKYSVQFGMEVLIECYLRMHNQSFDDMICTTLLVVFVHLVGIDEVVSVLAWQKGGWEVI